MATIIRFPSLEARAEIVVDRALQQFDRAGYGSADRDAALASMMRLATNSALDCNASRRAREWLRTIFNVRVEGSQPLQGRL